MTYTAHDQIYLFFKLQPVAVSCDSMSLQIWIQSSDKTERAKIRFVRLREGCFLSDSGNRDVCRIFCPTVNHRKGSVTKVTKNLQGFSLEKPESGNGWGCEVSVPLSGRG